jgi:AcrR family transcriptional regulator
MDSKEKILKAALRVFLEKGYDAASINDVAQESKFTKGGLYHHFPNK